MQVQQIEPISLPNCRSLPQRRAGQQEEVDINLQTQLRNQFYIFKKFVATVSKIDSHFKKSFQKRVPVQNKIIVPDSFFAFRDRFLFDFQHGLTAFINTEIEKLTDNLSQVTQKLAEGNTQNPHFTQSKASILNTDINSIAKECEETLKDSLLLNYGNSENEENTPDGGSRNHAEDLRKQLEQFSHYLGMAKPEKKDGFSLASNQILHNPPNSNLISSQSFSPNARKQQQEGNSENAGAKNGDYSPQSFNLVSNQNALQSSIDMSVTLQYSQLSPENETRNKSIPLQSVIYPTENQTPRRTKISSFDEGMIPTSLENTENTAKQQSFIMMESNPLVAITESQISDIICRNQPSGAHLRTKNQQINQFQIGTPQLGSVISRNSMINKENTKQNEPISSHIPAAHIQSKHQFQIPIV